MNKDSQIELTPIEEKIKEVLVTQGKEGMAFMLDNITLADFNKRTFERIAELSTLLNTEIEKERKQKKADIEQHMVFLFKKLPKFIITTKEMSKKRKDSLWGNMCMWTDEYLNSLPKSEKDSK